MGFLENVLLCVLCDLSFGKCAIYDYLNFEALHLNHTFSHLVTKPSAQLGIVHSLIALRIRETAKMIQLTHTSKLIIFLFWGRLKYFQGHTFHSFELENKTYAKEEGKLANS